MGCTRVKITQNKNTKHQPRDHNSETDNGKQPLLYVTRCLDPIQIPVKFHEDINNGY